MKTMYHITSIDNWESIQEYGLVPQYGFLSDMVMEQLPGVYMFLEKDEVNYAMQHWFGDMIRYVYDREKLILLEIQIPDDFGIEERFGWEAISRSTIPAEYIKIVDFEGKKDFNRK
ncbi:hypothetical protein ACTNEW_15280 [Blautia sp. HCP3S3_G3]|uniref:hypothetical protein n=1 Tax=Blautia sp. HCP3S3_G3 TaxID=3438913 RepID=UPI003F8C5891